MKLAAVDYVILAVYFGFVLGIGWRLRKKIATSGDFLTSGRSVPVWITSLAFLAANLGAQELVGMSGNGAKYGIMTAHFYWVGAVPAMIFVGLFMMPFYWGSRARSVPEYLKLRFDEKTRALNALTFAGMTVFSSGISMYALGLLLQLILGWSFTTSVLLFGGDRAGLHLPGRPDQRDLQRGAAILPDRDGLLAAGDHGGDEGRRMGRDGRAAVRHDAARRHERRRDDAQLEVPGHTPARTPWESKCSAWWRGWAS